MIFISSDKVTTRESLLKLTHNNVRFASCIFCQVTFLLYPYVCDDALLKVINDYTSCIKKSIHNIAICGGSQLS